MVTTLSPDHDRSHDGHCASQREGIVPTCQESWIPYTGTGHVALRIAKHAHYPRDGRDRHELGAAGGVYRKVSWSFHSCDP